MAPCQIQLLRISEQLSAVTQIEMKYGNSNSILQQRCSSQSALTQSYLEDLTSPNIIQGCLFSAGWAEMQVKMEKVSSCQFSVLYYWLPNLIELGRLSSDSGGVCFVCFKYCVLLLC